MWNDMDNMEERQVSLFFISFHYSTCLSSILSISYHYSTCLSALFFHIISLINLLFKLKSEKIWNYGRKVGWIVKWYRKYGKNREKIWKIRKKNSEKIWKIWKKGKLNPYLFTIFFCIFSIFSLFSSIFSISFQYSTYFSSIFFISFHYSTRLSSILSIEEK
jgi:hypothetical protein